MKKNPENIVTDNGYRSKTNFKKESKINTVFLGKSIDVSPDKEEYCRSARSATEGYIAVAKNLRGFDKSLYRGYTGARIWTLLSQGAFNLKKLLQLYYLEKIPEKSLIKLKLLE